jgi:hypothetical protein
VVFGSGVSWCVIGVLCFELVFDIRCLCYYILYYTIIHYYYYILYTIIISYTSLLLIPSPLISSFFSSLPIPFPYIFYLLSFPILFSSLPFHFCSSILLILIQSILVGTYIYLFIFFQYIFSSSSSSLIPPLIHSILVDTYIYLLILFPHQQTDPAHFIGGMSRVV